MSANIARHILAPVDFSELSAHALRYAGRLAKCSGADLTALYADPFEPPPYFTERHLEQVKEQFETAKGQAEAYLRKFLAAQIPDLDGARAVVREGLPADAIRGAATDLGADLIVMGTHGRNGLNRLMLGSITERVLRESGVPVLAVRGDWKEREIRRILCPVNDSAPARRALAMATGLASCLGATVRVLHVREDGATDSIGDLCGWIPEEQRKVCSTLEVTGARDVAQEVVSLAKEADLLVVGAQHRTFSDVSVLGTHTIRIVRHAPCPVLAVFGVGERAALPRIPESDR